MFSSWKPYVPVAKRRASATRFAATLKKKGVAVSPVVVQGRAIARSFWGKAWCENLEAYSDFSNRLPRGRTYVRNGSVVHLGLERGAVHAHVAGSRMYETRVEVTPLVRTRWKELVQRHSSQVSSLVDLLQGRLPTSLLEALADRSSGLFPAPKELKFECSCPDWATMCKHVAAVLYGVGARLDAQPELFFLLRGVEVSDLATSGATPDFGAGGGSGDLGAEDLGALFGIELAGEAPAGVAGRTGRRKAASAPAGSAPAKARAARAGVHAKSGRGAAAARVGVHAKSGRANAGTARVGVHAKSGRAKAGTVEAASVSTASAGGKAGAARAGVHAKSGRAKTRAGKAVSEGRPANATRQERAKAPRR